MNIQQLEYIVAVDKYRHFATAAEKCFVTQPTLSMMIRKLEEELGVQVFERSKQPVVPTREGVQLIAQAQRILHEVTAMRDHASELRGEISGSIRLGIIPTLAPYLLPLFLKALGEKYPQLEIHVKEMITDDVIEKIGTGEIDMGLLATPLHEPQIEEHLLCYEEFFAYASASEKLGNKKYVLPAQINIRNLWLLEEGHCLRNQVYNLCELKKKAFQGSGLHYEAGSIETLINLVDAYDGITIIPHLAVLRLSARQKKHVREFVSPRPAREISLVTAKSFPRKRLVKAIMDEILRNLPKEVTENPGIKRKKVIAI